MNIYDRIINILLEARVEMFIQDRLDEATPTSRAKRVAKISSKMVGAKPERVEQLSKGDPVTQALRKIRGSTSAIKPHRVFIGRGETKISPHIKTQTSGLKRAVATVKKHG